MIEVLFTESAAGSMLESPGVGTVVCIPLSLSMGDISDPLSDHRAQYLQSMIRIPGAEFTGVGTSLVAAARDGISRIRDAAHAAEPIRIWYSQNPDELCGICHLMTLIPEETEVICVELPAYLAQERSVVTFTCWGDAEPAEFLRCLPLARPLSAVERRYFAAQWRVLAGENSPLRAVINGRLLSVDAAFYDPFILSEIALAGETFREARLVGNVLGKHQLGISDWLVAGRIEQFISMGMLIPLTKAEENLPIYHRVLKKST